MDGWKSTTDFLAWILKEKVQMSMIGTHLNGTDYFTSTEKRICLTKDEFNWIYKKVYD